MTETIERRHGDGRQSSERDHELGAPREERREEPNRNGYGLK